jgi:hypothetical protein
MSEPRFYPYLADHPEKNYQVNKNDQVKIVVRIFSNSLQIFADIRQLLKFSFFNS